MSYPPQSIAGIHPQQQITSIMQALCETATAGGTLTLNSNSDKFQYMSGSMAHTVVLPVVDTLKIGHQFHVFNDASVDVTVQSSGLNTITTVVSGGATIFSCISLTGTSPSSWSFRNIFRSGPGFGSSPTYQAIADTSLTLTASADYIFPTLLVNTSGSYNTSNGRYTTPVAGWYSFSLITTTANSIDIGLVFRGRIATVYNQDIIILNTGVIAGQYSYNHTYIAYCDANQPFYWTTYNAITGGRQEMRIISMF